MVEKEHFSKGLPVRSTWHLYLHSECLKEFNSLSSSHGELQKKVFLDRNDTSSYFETFPQGSTESLIMIGILMNVWIEWNHRWHQLLASLTQYNNSISSKFGLYLRRQKLMNDSNIVYSVILLCGIL